MSIYDILMLAVLVGSIVFGLWKGLAWQVASLASIFVSYFVALNFRGPLSAYITAEEPWNRFAAMLILFLATSLVIWMAYGYMKKTIQRLKLRGFDSQAGALLGAFKGGLLCMLITLFAVTLFGNSTGQAVIGSKSGAYITTAINRLHAMVPSEIHAVLDTHVKEFNDKLTQQNLFYIPDSEQKFDDKFKTIRGQFQSPESGVPAVNPPGANVQLNSNNGSQPSIGDELLEATKAAGKQFIDNSLNR